MYIKEAASNIDAIVVQTPSMAGGVESALGIRPRVVRFVRGPQAYARRGRKESDSKTKGFDFLYVASGEPHKNHANLVAAWKLLAEEAIHPSLCFTLDCD